MTMEDGETSSQYLRFVENDLTGRRRYQTWDILSQSSGVHLGQVHWYSRWQQYCFYPEPSKIWNAQSLLDVAGFIIDRMAERK